MPNLRILEPLKAGLRNDFNPTAVGALYDAYGCESKGPGLVGYEYLPSVLSVASSVPGNALLFNVGENCCLYHPSDYFYTLSSSWNATALSFGIYNASSSAWTGNLLDDPSITSSSTWGISTGWTLSSDGGVYLNTASSKIQSIAQSFTPSTYSTYLAEVTTEFGEDAKNGLRLIFSTESVNIYESGTHRFILPPYHGGIKQVVVFADPGWVGNITKVSVIPPSNALPAAGNTINSIAEHPNGFLCTGTKNTYYYDNEFGLFEVKGKGITTACSHTDGRMYLAGKLGELFSKNTGDPWQRLLFTGGLLKLDMGTAEFGEDTKGLDSRCIYWSCIGMDDIFPLFFPYVDTDKEFLNRWERNECGFAFWPYNGDIYRLHSLGEGVMAYGAGGIAYLRPVGSPITVSMAAVGEYGLASATAFCGNSYVHYFIDYNDELWRVEAGPKLTKLGFKTYFATLSTIKMVLHPTENKVYISDSDTCYMLENDVLVEIPEIVHTMVMNKGSLGAIRTLLTDGFEVETGIFDFDSKDLKTVSRVSVDGFASSSGLHGKVFFRMDRASDWSDTGWITLPLDQRVTGQEFKFGVKATTSSSAYLNYIDVEFDADPTRYSLGDWIS